MRRHLHPEDLRLWSLVTATVRPAKGRTRPAPAVKTDEPPRNKRVLTDAKPADAQYPATLRTPMSPAAVAARPVATAGRSKPQPAKAIPEPIEPRRKRRISTAREPIGGRLDLHGLDQDQARAAVHAFIQRAHADGVRAVLIITGKGSLGDGVLRRRTPDWLAEPAIRPMVAGLAQAERHHGGEGALYVALKRNGRG